MFYTILANRGEKTDVSISETKEHLQAQLKAENAIQLVKDKGLLFENFSDIFSMKDTIETGISGKISKATMKDKKEEIALKLFDKDNVSEESFINEIVILG